MVKNHISRLAAPRTWELKRKETKWIARPNSGPHAIKDSVTIDLLLKSLLKYAKTTKEVKKILHDKLFVVDKKVRRDHKYPVGIMDCVELPKLKEQYQVLFDKNGKIVLYPIKNTDMKLLKVVGKKVLKKGKLQINFHDGKNVLVDKFAGKSGDTVVFDLNKKKVVKVLKLEKGALVYLTGGKNVGVLGKVKEVINAKGLESPKIICTIDGKDNETLKNYAFVVDKGLMAI